MIDFDLFRSVLKRRAVAFVLAVSGLASTGCSGDASHDDARGYVGRPPASPPASVPTSATQNPGTNVNLGGSQDTGFLRGQLEAGLVPTPAALDAVSPVNPSS